LIAALLPEEPLFAVNTFIAGKWWVKPFLALAHTYALDPTNPMAVKSLINEIKFYYYFNLLNQFQYGHQYKNKTFLRNLMCTLKC